MFSISAAFPSPIITLTSQSTPIVSTPYGVLCTISVLSSIADSTAINVWWLTSLGEPIIHSGSSVTLPLTTNTTTTTELQFDPLHTSHGGVYKCQVYTSIPALSLSREQSSSWKIVAQSKDDPQMCMVHTNTSFYAFHLLDLLCCFPPPPTSST